MAKSKKNIKKAKKYFQKPMKLTALIVSAIQDLRETKGSTLKKILGYITYASNLPERRIKRHVNAALKRGVEYGILRRYRGHFYLPAGDELERANKIAGRFARLSSPNSLTNSKGGMSKSEVRKNEELSPYCSPSHKPVKRTHSLPISSTSLDKSSFNEYQLCYNKPLY